MAAMSLRDRLLYLAVWFACFAPILWFVFQGLAPLALPGISPIDLGANPIEYIIRQLGVWGLRLLLVGLAITPVARLLKAPRLIRYRRTVGLWAFTYIILHLSTYVGVDHFFDWETIGKDILKRPYITIGMTAFTLLIPLAVTSTDGMLRRLGPKAWKRLHQLIYVIAPLGVVHYFLLVKKDTRPPLAYGAILAVLLAYRLYAWRKQKRGRAARDAARAAAKTA